MTVTENLLARGWQYHQAGELAQAETIYRQLVQADSNHAEAFALLGAACLAQNKLVEAELALRRTLALQPGHAAALDNLGTVLTLRGKVDEAIAC